MTLTFFEIKSKLLYLAEGASMTRNTTQTGILVSGVVYLGRRKRGACFQGFANITLKLIFA